MLFPRPGAFERAFLFSVFGFSLVVPFVLAETWNGSPLKSDLIFDGTDELEVAWSTISSKSYMSLWCQGTEDSVFSREFNIPVPGTGSRILDLREYAYNAPICYLEVADAKTGSPGLNSPYFYINNLESIPPIMWSFPDRDIPISDSTAPHSTSSLRPEAQIPLRRKSTEVISTDYTSIKKRTTQIVASTPTPAQNSNAVGGLSINVIICVSLGAGIVVITLLATFWYILRSHRMSNMNTLEDHAAVKASDFESTRAVSEISTTNTRSKNFSYPVDVEYRHPPCRD